MSRILLSLAATAALTMGAVLPSADAQDGYSSGRNFYRNSRYTYSDSAWCAPSPSGGFYCYPKGEPAYTRGDVGAYAKNSWRHGLYTGNGGPTGNIVK